jgi:hypothetical protein
MWKDTSGGRPNHFGVEDIHALGGHNHGIDTSRIGCANDVAHIPRVFDFMQNNRT